MFKRLACILAVGVFLVGASFSSVLAKSKFHFSRQPVYYLSLGTSLAAGVQADPETGENVLTDVSYPSMLAKMIGQSIRKLRHVNIGCPGETAETMIFGGLCDYPKGSQLDQAVQFLHAHAKFTGLITIDVGANDVLQCVNGTDIDLVCLEEKLAQLTFDLAFILEALHEAAPGVPIIGMNYYNPLLVYLPYNPGFAEETVNLQLWVNSVLEGVYEAYHVPVADVAEAFMSYDLITDDNSNTVPDSFERLCAWTWMCSHQNIHANDMGYSVMAGQFYSLLPEIYIPKLLRKFRK